MNTVLTIITLAGGVLYPVYAAINGKKTRVWLQENQDKLAQSYQTIMLTQWILIGPALAMLIYNSDYQTMGLAFLDKPLDVLGLFAIPLLVLLILYYIPLPQKVVTALKKQMIDSSFILPKKRNEFRWTILLSFTAGICEEILFRGLFYTLLLGIMPVVPAIAVSSLFFCLGHISTGLKNTLYTLALGLIWSVIYYYTGSLWIPIVTHIIIDLYSMTTAYRIFKQSVGPAVTAELEEAG